MAAYTSTKSGNWSDSTVWGGMPTSADACIIASGHTVTLDTTGCVCSTLTINSGGTLTTSTSANTSITAQTTITNNGTWTCDLSASATYTCAISGNNSAAASDNCISLGALCTTTWKGYPRTRRTRLNGAIIAGATSATVTDATGWQVGDIIVFATTQDYNATPRTDLVTLTSVNTGTGAIGWTGGITYDHANNGYVGNFTSNIVIGPPSGAETRRHNVFWTQGYGAGTPSAKLIDNVQFYAGNQSSYNKIGQFSFGDGSSTAITSYNLTLSNNAHYDFRALGIMSYGAYHPITVSGCVFYSQNSTNNPIPMGSNGWGIGYGDYTSNLGTISGCGVFRSTGGASSGIYINSAGVQINDTFVSGCASRGLRLQAALISLTAVESYSNLYGYQYGSGDMTLTNCDTGIVGINSISDLYGAVACTINRIGGTTQTIVASALSSMVDASQSIYKDKNNDVTLQEIYRPFMAIKRDNSNANRSTSSIAIYPTVISTDCQRTLSIPCANGSSIRVVGYVKKSHASNVGATVAITGLGSSVTPFTKAADTNWEQYDLSATNSSGNDGNFTLTYTANSSSGTTNVVYFDGVPDAPFVTKCRHYGFTYDEASPIRTVNATVSATEANALLLGDTEITVTAATSAIALNASRTLQEVYDYTQAWACTTANLGYTVPLTGVGIAGSPSLFAVGNITTTGYTLNGGGSLSMGSKTLTASLPFAYTYTGGTFSQAATVPTFAGGTLNIGAAGTYTFTQAAAMILSMTPTAPGTYALGAASITGQVDLRNTTAHAITVKVPSGTTTTTANNTGGTITVSTPQTYQSVTLTGVTAGSRVQIYDVTNSTELFNGTSGYSWTDPTPAAGSRAIRIRVSYVFGATAKEFIETSIGTCGTTEPSNAVTYLVSQVNDATYNANAVDGSTVTGVTFTDSSVDKMNIDISAGVDLPALYAAWVYYASTEAGIRTDIDYIEAIDEANYVYSNLVWKNTTSPSVPLKISGGYAWDAVTLDPMDLIDTTGGTIFLAPPHVVAKVVSVGGANIITGDIATVVTAVNGVPAATLAAAQATPIHANMEQTNGINLKGDGTLGDKFRSVLVP